MQSSATSNRGPISLIFIMFLERWDMGFQLLKSEFECAVAFKIYSEHGMLFCIFNNLEEDPKIKISIANLYSLSISRI